MSVTTFLIEKPQFDPASGIARFTYGLDAKKFIEVLEFPALADATPAAGSAFAKLLDLTAMVLGVSYYKLLAPLTIAAPDIALTQAERAFVLDVYENGLGEFYARNDLRRFGRLTLSTPADAGPPPQAQRLPERALLPIGGGKDSLVSVTLLETVGVKFTPFAVNPKGPILTSVDKIGLPPVYVTRTLDKEMIRLSKEPGYYNGHVPSTAINSMIAALCALLYGYDRIVLSNERSASEGNVSFDGREANHQYSKSIGFEAHIAKILAGATDGKLRYFSLLRPFSEAKIASMFVKSTRFDRVFSSCNRNFRLTGHDGPLWCGECPKCHFVFLMFAPVMDKERLIGIFGRNLLDEARHEQSFRELAGLAGQKPWECVGEILEAASYLYRLTEQPAWQNDAIVRLLRPSLLSHYGVARLEAALDELMTDSPAHYVPPDLAEKLAVYAR